MLLQNKQWLDDHRELLFTGLREGNIRGLIRGKISRIMVQEFNQIIQVDEDHYHSTEKAILRLYKTYDEWLAKQPAQV